MKKLSCFIILIVFILSCSKSNPVQQETDDENSFEPVYNWIDGSPAWSPDGNKVAYVHRDSLLTHGYSYELWVVDVNTLEKQMLSAFGGPPDWSPDGNWITFSYVYVFKIKPNGDSLTQLTSGASCWYSKWLPDGKRISYYDFYNGIRVINEDGSNDTLWIAMPFLTEYDWSRLFQFSYTADGSDSSGSYTGIFIADSMGNNVQRIYFENTPHVYTVEWSPSSTQLVFEGGRYVNIYTINSDGSNKKQLTTEGGEEPDWSPIGDKIVYCRHSWYIDPSIDSRNGYLWIMNTDGSNKQQITFP